MTNVFIIAALSADGFIAKETNHPATWTSKEDKKKFVEMTKRAGVVVVGGQTFNMFPHPLPDRLNVVYSRTMESSPGVEVTQEAPQALVRRLGQMGYKEIAIIGGAQIYTMFMEAGLIDTLYLTIEPVIFGSGIRLFNKPLNRNLKLVSSAPLSDNTIMLKYHTM